MSGQASQNTATSLINHLGGIAPTLFFNGVGNLPTTWLPGQRAYDYSQTPPAQYHWNGSAWVSGAATLYIALLTSDPSQASIANPGTYAQTVADIAAIEDTTAGYARQVVTFGTSGGANAYSGATTYTSGQQVYYNGCTYQCNVASVTGTAPTGTVANNADWTLVGVGSSYPAQVANTNQLTWTYTASQALPVQWAALVNVSSGSAGELKYMWTLPVAQQVQATQSIQAGIGSFVLAES
jgi:hypothetical protein